ncbi:MAG: 16S rRNA (uracil(1498)-N(3))-methyltransferase [Muribaculaceae bacterium]|nr:16S rRNA (uracil(1498)-N(3))-methyltransferase [Muribaculaceae bacterium]
MPRFYAPDIARTLALPEEEARHCTRVLRMHEGDVIEVVDGAGRLYQCRITLAHDKRCNVEIVEQVSQPAHWGHDIVLAIAPTKNLDRIEWVVEKATEMGIDRIVPLLCCNSERKVLKTERLHKIAVAAMKQSLKATLPVIDELTPFGRFITQPFEGNRFIAYCDPMLPRSERQLFARQYVPHAHTLVLIGPEGDFSPEEVQQALAAGFIPVSLGESRLRTETAAIMAVASCHALDMSNPKL